MLFLPKPELSGELFQGIMLSNPDKVYRYKYDFEGERLFTGNITLI